MSSDGPTRNVHAENPFATSPSDGAMESLLAGKKRVVGGSDPSEADQPPVPPGQEMAKIPISSGLLGGGFKNPKPPGRSGEHYSTPQSGTDSTVRVFSARGRNARRGLPFKADISVGKIGVLGFEEAEQLEMRLMHAMCDAEISLADRSVSVRDSFLSVLFLYLAINSGSVGNTTGRLGVRDDSEPLRFSGVQLSAVEVATVLGDKAYAYMRVRATEIRDAIESAFATAALPDAEVNFPGIVFATDLLRVAAAKRGLSQYPQYAAVGSEYAAGTPPYLIAIIQASSATTVDAPGASNVRANG